MRDALYLIDGYGLIYRSYFAFLSRPLTNPKGENTSAVNGFFRSLFQLINKRKPPLLAVILDSKTPTFRHEKFPEYKANRDKAPQDLHAQVPVIKNILKALGIMTLQKDGFEADDLIATLSARCQEQGRECYILSGDKDLLQLVGGGVRVISQIKGTKELQELDREDVFETRGFYPEQVTDYLALAGDTADNIPGVRGIGEKRACKLLSMYENLESIYENLESIQPDSLKQKLISDRDNAFFSKDLAVLRKDVPIEDISESFKLEMNTAEAIPLFAEQGMKKIVEELGGKIDEEKLLRHMRPGIYETVLDEAALIRWINEAKKKQCFAFDTETDSLDEMNAGLIGFSLAVGREQACYIPVKACDIKTLPADFVKEALSSLLCDPNLLLIGQNIKYDYKVMKCWGLVIKNRLFDTMIAAWLLDSSLSSFGMDNLAEKYLEYRTIRYHDVVEKGKTLADASIEKVSEYSAEDADITFQLYEFFSGKLDSEGLTQLFYELEMPLLEILAQMELTGIRLDPKQLEIYNEELKIKLDRLEQDIHSECGHPFNIRSTKELQKVLFTERKLKPVKKIKTGYSTDSQVLQELAREDTVSKLVLRHRVLSKLKSTYVETLPKQVNPLTERLHTQYLQTGAATGRLASKNPNLQNIPVREESGRRIRTAFVPESGFIFLSADYAQIELAVLAHLSQDEELLNAVNENKDIHVRTASALFGIPEKDITPDQRRIGKTVNFGVIYGMSAFRLARDLDISRKKADEFIKRYFELYSGVDRFIKETVLKAEQTGFVKTIMGRKRKVPGILSRNRLEKNAAERVAVNSPIQGSAADIVKKAMIDVYKAIHEKETGARLLLQVHDELIFEVPETNFVKAGKIIIQAMENAVTLSVPLHVSVERGKSWGEIH